MTLVALLGATFVGTLNNSVANVAVPDISDDFDVSVGTGVWFVSSFVLAVAVLMPLAGRLGDLLGAKRVFLAGLALFMISSLVVAVARTFPVAVLGRTMQGASGSTVLPCIMVTIARLFGPTQRGRAVGLWAAVNAAALAAGPALGGAVVQLWGWRAIFWLDLPASLIVMLAAWVLVPSDGPTSRGKLDLFGASLFTTALVAVTVAFGRGADWGWTDRLTIGLLAIAPVAAAWFVYVERRTTHPFIDLGLFRRGAYRALTGVASLQMVALFAITLAVPVYLVEGRGMHTGIAGLTTAALPASMLAGAPLAGWLADRVAARRILSAGAVLVIAGALGLIAWPTTTVLLVLALVVVGLGISGIQSPAAAAATNVVSDAERGVALGLFNTCRFVLGGLGATAAALAFEAAAGGERTAGSAGLSAAEAGFRAAIAVAVLAGLAALAAARAVPEDLAAATDPTSVDDQTAASAPSR